MKSYDRNIAGHYPIGTLRIGPTATTVDLVDNHGNDGLGQGSCEAIYVDHLIIETGATLNTNTCNVYYATLTNSGSVDQPDNLIRICNADAILDLVDFSDLNAFLLGPDGGLGTGCECFDFDTIATTTWT